ncbi:glutamine-hydrolyzing GMP synthase [Candidatus Magnetaquicoccus inordinatus]|uniref:glutamine-hydrolyzing GMP synthase n=1 Tax=Candidatus Magnetaquicoccus inordinatus TaxID=2496818 RepID=UPI00102C5441|nr:glutamine-hydrolyzing GMP synthase [Candidatus Magnetaquicoccus inordinatus]
MSADPIHEERILILDYGSQYTQLIARRVREAQVYSEIHPHSMSTEAIRAFKPKGIILSGGHRSVYDAGAPDLNPVILSLGVPVLGICYGMHLLARHFGGEVAPSKTREYGLATVWRHESHANPFPNFFRQSHIHGLSERPWPVKVWMSHGDHVTRVPNSFRILANSNNDIIAAIASKDDHLLGVQFHPEVNHTEQGELLIQDFVLGLCGCQGLWTAQGVIERESRLAREKVGNDHVILGLSGGVDSAVTAALLHRAIGTQLTCIFVDNGLLRLNEGDEVMATFAAHLGVRVIRVDAEERFLSRLQGVTDPEQKRRIIGHTFIEVFEEEAKKIDGVRWLAQGTIYPDVIESAGAKSATATTIKSHHNVGGLPEKMGLALLEPLRELFKDEVRQIGLQLGLPERMIRRHPFPGPGLGVRILGEVRKEFAELLRRADAIYMEELYQSGYYHKTDQAFAVFLPVKSVGVMGDGRSYDYVVALRAVETKDFMTAAYYPLPHDLLARIASRIINEVKGINRVTYDITSKPPGTIEWE